MMGETPEMAYYDEDQDKVIVDPTLYASLLDNSLLLELLIKHGVRKTPMWQAAWMEM